MSKHVPKPHVAVSYNVATHGDQTPMRIVLHDTESHDEAGVRDILGIAAFWQRQGRGLGSQFIVDGSGHIGQGASSAKICYHVANNNTGSIGIEQIGFAWWDLRHWRMRRKQLEAVAHLVAYLADRWNIPLVRSTDHGICTHADFHGDHTDPGRGYPFGYVLRRAVNITKKAKAKK